MKKILLFLMFALFCIPWVTNAQQSLPYSYGFEDNDLSVDGWTTQNPSGLNASEFGIIGTAAQTGDYGFRFSSYNDNGASTQYLISPELNAPTGVVVQFSYKASSSYTSGETFQVGYSTTNDDISSFTFGPANNATNTSWEQTEEFAFPAGTKYVAVYYSPNYQYRLFIDDITFSVPPACMKPLNLTYSVSGNEITLSWTSDATQWNVEVNGVATSTSMNPYTFTGDLATEYTVRVQADCGHNEVSDWTNPVSFTTPDCIGGHIIEYSLNDSYGDGWNGNAIQVIDGCGDLVETLTIASGNSNSGTFVLCGDYYQFVWVLGNYPGETSFTLSDNGTAIYSGQSGSTLTDGQELHTIGIQPPVKPTALTAGTPGANEVQLSWTENGTATTWQICINDDENNLVVANSNPFTLTDLNAVTAYTVKVRSTDGTNISCWSNVVSFTTDSYCPTPNNLTVTNLMPTSATLNWEGEADSYNVRYAVAGGDVAIFEDGFENGLDNWTIYTQGEAPNADGWGTFNASNLTDLTNHGGSYVASAWSWSTSAYDADNWLVTPQIDLQGTLKFWETTAGNWPDSYEVLLSTSGNSISDFTITLREMQQATGDWSEVSIDLSSYAGQQGYIAIHHVSNDANYLFIDDFGIYATQDAGEWINATSTTNSLDITGLTSETNYMFQVQAVCGTEGESSWSTVATFTTPSACDAPNTLPAEVDGTTATLSWNGYQESINLKYRKQVADPTAPATIIITVPDVWGDGSGYQMLLDADANTYGTIIPETGGLTESGDASEEIYAEFEYKIPTNADGSLTTENILVNQTVTIEIPAGTYDWCITNPTPEDRVWIASSQGNVSGRQDDFVFEPGVTYEFTVGIHGTNDGVDLTVTRPMSNWVVVENVTSPYNLTGLDPETYYEWQVEGINADCANALVSEIDNFTTGIRCGIVFDENNKWDEDFENMTTSTKLFTGVTPQCWTVAHEYTSPSINHIGLEADTLPQLYHSFNTTENGHYSLRIKYRSLLAMPELDESIDLSRVRMSLNVRQPQTYYKLQIGVMSDLDDESTFVPVATVNNASTTMEEFVCDFSSYTGGGRYIAFKNVGGSTSDPYCSNYLDDIVLTYVEEAGCAIAAPFPYKQDFEGFTTSGGASGVEPDCWEVISEDVALDASTKPQVYRGFNTTTDGHYSLRMKNRCVYAMPEFAEDVDVKELTLSFSLRQAKSFYRLEVGVVDAAGNFVVVEEINNSSTSMEDVTVDFSTLEGEGTGKRIAFHNILRNSANYDYSYNYIDDINLYYTSEGAEGDKNMEFAGSDEMNADHYLDNIAVYPNPTTGMLHIDAVDVQKVECYSQMGQLVGVYDNVNELNISELANGVYMLRITVPQGVTMRKVVKR